jgi:cyclic pyranopterin phosphate synthase
VRLTHTDEQGSARMVDVGEKPVSTREAIAEGRVRMSPEAFTLVREQAVAKGDVLAVARLAGIAGAKRTAELVPLCHPIALDLVEVDVQTDPDLPGIRITARARATARTGVEMEALTAVATACLTVYDMVKAVDRGMRIEGIRLMSKTGGTRGDWNAPPNHE